MSYRAEVQARLQAAAEAVARISGPVRLNDQREAISRIADALRAIHAAQAIAGQKEASE